MFCNRLKWIQKAIETSENGDPDVRANIYISRFLLWSTKIRQENLTLQSGCWQNNAKKFVKYQNDQENVVCLIQGFDVFLH